MLRLLHTVLSRHFGEVNQDNGTCNDETKWSLPFLIIKSAYFLMDKYIYLGWFIH